MLRDDRIRGSVLFAPATPGLFFSNIVDSFGFTTLSVPFDPEVAERRFC